MPLTQWNAALTGTENAFWPQMIDIGGSGTGTITTSYSVDFRADVHPTVATIDTAPVPQNFAFSAVEGDSTAHINSITGSFLSSDGTSSATFSLNDPGSLSVHPPPFSNTFDIGANSGQPSNCNSGIPGPGAAPNNVFCPALGFAAPNAGTCDDDPPGDLCESALWNVSGAINGAASGDGTLMLTLDPSDYSLSVSSTSANTTTAMFESFHGTISGGVTGTVDMPVSPPSPPPSGGSQAPRKPAGVRRLSQPRT